MLLGAYIANGYDNIVGAQRCQILEGDRSPVDPVLSGHPRIADTLGTLNDIACESSVVKHVDTVGAVRRTEIADIPARGSENVTGVGVDHGRPGLAVPHGDLHQLLSAVRLEPDLSVEPAGKSGVDGEELIHLLLVTRADETKVEPVNLQRDQKLVYRLHSDHVWSAVVMALHQTVDLVHEQDPTQRSVYQFIGLRA